MDFACRRSVAKKTPAISAAHGLEEYEKHLRQGYEAKLKNISPRGKTKRAAAARAPLSRRHNRKARGHSAPAIWPSSSATDCGWIGAWRNTGELARRQPIVVSGCNRLTADPTVDRIKRGESYIGNLSGEPIGGIQRPVAELHGLTSDGLLQRSSRS
jgi:hypothetical protein